MSHSPSPPSGPRPVTGPTTSLMPAPPTTPPPPPKRSSNVLLQSPLSPTTPRDDVSSSPSQSPRIPATSSSLRGDADIESRADRKARRQKMRVLRTACKNLQAEVSSLKGENVILKEKISKMKRDYEAQLEEMKKREFSYKNQIKEIKQRNSQLEEDLKFKLDMISKDGQVTESQLRGAMKRLTEKDKIIKSWEEKFDRRTHELVQLADLVTKDQSYLDQAVKMQKAAPPPPPPRRKLMPPSLAALPRSQAASVADEVKETILAHHHK
mmetsp:Transcript_17318/g.25967  ORF Transcript_17318/g.25967 Transcript_17318/m.25967 type:complete len:268 (+) Transcript_17318:93-896(+)|eukprot:CAMPEP_0167754474 /NCGR_PEP_ID=MMETSP0110_2-20121227/8286_1 /TAXON_ID=629695 /ORGANISM="Gymnochlora sp., Strain CCMP2014" /LENGTH=267 /DNA_ID=CAMNT_0007640349 /DNA_START=32 /DNA_END=835 /DNA_ORIENTATION=-